MSDQISQHPALRSRKAELPAHLRRIKIYGPVQPSDRINDFLYYQLILNAHPLPFHFPAFISSFILYAVNLNSQELNIFSLNYLNFNYPIKKKLD